MRECEKFGHLARTVWRQNGLALFGLGNAPMQRRLSLNGVYWTLRDFRHLIGEIPQAGLLPDTACAKIVRNFSPQDLSGLVCVLPYAG